MLRTPAPPTWDTPISRSPPSQPPSFQGATRSGHQASEPEIAFRPPPGALATTSGADLVLDAPSSPLSGSRPRGLACLRHCQDHATLDLQGQLHTHVLLDLLCQKTRLTESPPCPGPHGCLETQASPILGPRLTVTVLMALCPPLSLLSWLPGPVPPHLAVKASSASRPLGSSPPAPPRSGPSAPQLLPGPSAPLGQCTERPQEVCKVSDPVSHSAPLGCTHSQKGPGSPQDREGRRTQR